MNMGISESTTRMSVARVRACLIKLDNDLKRIILVSVVKRAADVDV